MIKQFLVSTAAVFAMAFTAHAAPVAAPATGTPQGPYEVISSTTQEVMDIIIEAKEQGYVKTDPERFQKKIEASMDKAVDFASFARGVMGKYGDKRYYDSLKTEAEKKAFLERITRFTEQFKSGLINTYSQGLLAFDGNRIEVIPPEKGDIDDGSAVIVQQIYGDRSQPYNIKYLMRDDGNGVWRCRNVLIEGIDLGRTYRGQFNAGLYRYKGDVDKVVETWSVAVGSGS